MIKKSFLVVLALLFVEVVSAQQNTEEVVITINGAVCEVIRIGTPCVIEISVKGSFSGGRIRAKFSTIGGIFEKNEKLILSETAVFEPGENTTKRITATAVPEKEVCYEPDSPNICNGSLGFSLTFRSTEKRNMSFNLFLNAGEVFENLQIETSAPIEIYRDNNGFNDKVKVLQPLCRNSQEDLINGVGYTRTRNENGFNLLCSFKELNIEERFEEPYVHNVYDQFDLLHEDDHGDDIVKRERDITDNLGLPSATGTNCSSSSCLVNRVSEAKDSILSISLSRPFRATQFCTTERAQELVGDGIFITSAGNRNDNVVSKESTTQAVAFSDTRCKDIPGTEFRDGEVIHDTTTKTAVIMVVGTVSGTNQRSPSSASCGLYGDTGMCIGSSYFNGTSFSAPRVATYLRILTHLFGVNVETAWRGMKACAKKGEPFEIGIGAVDMSCFDDIETGSVVEFSELTGVPLEQVTPLRGRVEETTISVVYTPLVFTDLNEPLSVRIVGVFRDKWGRIVLTSEQSVQLVRENGATETRRLSEGLNIDSSERGNIVIKTVGGGFITTTSVTITTPTSMTTRDVFNIRGNLLESILFLHRNVVKNIDVKDNTERNLVTRLREPQIQMVFDVTGDGKLTRLDTRVMVRYLSGIHVENRRRIESLFYGK